ncbi:DUF397 domain-containing protein [Streptomyces sp. NPDC059010]|uniref:DUF397 domain-containing protein n=1 Tax=Streptomyces sp. NPDC059010 TaxID=3346695 RepID=UPI0036ABFA6C
MPADPHTISGLTWFKSSYSGGNATECVEAAVIPVGVLIRDSKRSKSPLIAISAEAWSSFVASARCIPDK